MALRNVLFGIPPLDADAGNDDVEGVASLDELAGEIERAKDAVASAEIRLTECQEREQAGVDAFLAEIARRGLAEVKNNGY